LFLNFLNFSELFELTLTDPQLASPSGESCFSMNNYLFILYFVLLKGFSDNFPTRTHWTETENRLGSLSYLKRSLVYKINSKAPNVFLGGENIAVDMAYLKVITRKHVLSSMYSTSYSRD
jgi:hypothetical protein